MKKYNNLLPTLFLLLVVFSDLNAQSLQTDYPISPVDFTQVKLNDGFWKSRVRTAIDVTIPYAFNKCEETGRVNNFIFAGGLEEGKFIGKFGFNDSDLYKIMEGAAYSLMTQKDPELRSYLDKLVSYLDAAQEEDGYLYTAWTLKANDYADMTCCSYHEKGKWIGSQFSHELYNAGHMYEAAVAHYLATGTKDFLNIATKNADLIYKVCVTEGNKYYPGHQEIELGLVKLYRATGNEKYLELAKLFLDRRGKGYRNYGLDEDMKSLDFDAYSQDHQPVIDQTEAVGHSVRAGYMYASMADIAAIKNDEAYLRAIDKIWEDIVTGKMYVTGGLGAGHGIEGFDVAYSLPNDAYAETCAAIANVYWNHRMFLLHGDAKYIDILERSLYNGLIAGLSLEGDKFFYPNPLVFDGEEPFNQGANCRSDWFNCSCCPSNLSRFIPSVAGYTYAFDQSKVYVNLFMNNTTEIEQNGQKLILEQRTNYPWDGKVEIRMKNIKPVKSSILIRLPGWSANDAVSGDLYTFENQASKKTSIKVNGVDYPFRTEKGYAIVEGAWKIKDRIEVLLPMEIKTVKSHEKVSANTGKVAVQRGPLVYCAEGVDNGGHATGLGIRKLKKMKAQYKPGLLDGVVQLKGKGRLTGSDGSKNVPLKLVPYYAWSHRGIGPMAVWLNQ